MKGLKAVLWDMDGVLVDTGDFHYSAWKTTLLNYGIHFSRQEFRATFGMNNEGILQLLLGDRFTNRLYLEISEEKEVNFRESIRGQLKLLPGVLPLLVSIAQANIPQAVGSSAPQENIDVIVRELNIGRHFRALVSAVGMPSKPDPAVFLAAARTLNAPLEKCVVIEDSTSGVEASRRAGMKCVAVATTNTAAELKAADLIVDRLDSVTLADLVALLE